MVKIGLILYDLAYRTVVGDAIRVIIHAIDTLTHTFVICVHRA